MSLQPPYFNDSWWLFSHVFFQMGLKHFIIEMSLIDSGDCFCIVSSIWEKSIHQWCHWAELGCWLVSLKFFNRSDCLVIRQFLPKLFWWSFLNFKQLSTFLFSPSVFFVVYLLKDVDSFMNLQVIILSNLNSFIIFRLKIWIYLCCHLRVTRITDSPIKINLHRAF